MAVRIFCDICSQRDLCKDAKVWYLLCEESLCVDCYDHHSLSKATKGHEVIDVEKVDGLLLGSPCKMRDSACCVLCLKEKHRDCCGVEIEPLSETAKNI